MLGLRNILFASAALHPLPALMTSQPYPPSQHRNLQPDLQGTFLTQQTTGSITLSATCDVLHQIIQRCCLFRKAHSKLIITRVWHEIAMMNLRKKPRVQAHPLREAL